ncbi:endonuclease III domain-containing protein [Calditrichota bacterium]
MADEQYNENIIQRHGKTTAMNLKRTRFLPNGLEPSQFIKPEGNFWGRVFNCLYQAWGDPFWWPASSAWEVAVGAVLTQNTAWRNVESAICNLESQRLTTPESILSADIEMLANTIRSSGYYNNKAKKLKELAKWWSEIMVGNRYKSLTDENLRERLIDVWGVGNETADSILCYALGRPLFTVDAYTNRIRSRLLGEDGVINYSELQNEVHSQLPRDTMLFNHFHGLLVTLGKNQCKSKNSLCRECPVLEICKYGKNKIGKSE